MAKKMTPLERARQNERLANEALAQGNIAAAQAYQANLQQQVMNNPTRTGVINVATRVNSSVGAASSGGNRNIESRLPEGGMDIPAPAGDGNTDTTPAPTGPSQEELNARQNAVDFFAEQLGQWGLGGLSGVINDLVIQYGPDAPSTIMAKIRDTSQYKQRFKGLLDLRSRGITDIENEGDYLRLESDYRRVFRQAGLTNYLGTPGSQAEYDAIGRIVSDFSLSVNEVEERITDAQRVVAETPQEVRDSFQRFYGIDPSTLTQYVLDPEKTMTEIQRRANAAIVGGYAQRAGLEFGAGVSERIGEFLGGERNIQGTQIEPQLTEIADIQRSTQRLAQIEQSDLSAETSALSALNLDQGARERVRTLQSRERARFSGRSGITTGSLSTGPGV